MAVWKLAPALAAGNCVVLKPAEQTPWSILKLMELIGDLLPAGVLNVVNGFGVEAGKPLASQPPDRQDRLHRRDHDRPADHAVRQPEHHPGHPGARRQEPEHLLRGRRRRSATPSTTRRSRASRCSPSTRARSAPARPGRWCSASIYSDFVPDAVARVEKIKQGNPLDTTTMIGAQASNDQLEKILSYIDIGRQEGAKVLTGGERNVLEGDLAEGYYVQPTDLRGRQLDADLPGGDLRAGRRR